jgi:hypothetical protein
MNNIEIQELSKKALGGAGGDDIQSLAKKALAKLYGGSSGDSGDIATLAKAALSKMNGSSLVQTDEGLNNDYFFKADSESLGHLKGKGLSQFIE